MAGDVKPEGTAARPQRQDAVTEKGTGMDVPPPGAGLNRRARALVDELVREEGERYGVRARSLANGALVVDAGVEAPGGYEAGWLLARICMADLAQIEGAFLTYGELALPGLVVRADRPAFSCLASQYAGWAIKTDGYFAMGSGPLRAVARVERELFEKLGYPARGERAMSAPGEGDAASARERGEASARVEGAPEKEGAEAGVLVLETRELPDEKVADWVAGRSGVAADRLAFVVAPTASVAGGVQISARVLETGLHKMEKLGFDVRTVLSGFGAAPLPPVAKNDLRAIGRTNDCILYGGRAAFTVRGDDAELEELARRVPSSASSDYGTPFYEIFKRYEGDFYKIDPLLFSPAEVAITNVASGRTFRAGAPNPEVLERSLFGG